MPTATTSVLPDVLPDNCPFAQVASHIGSGAVGTDDLLLDRSDSQTLRSRCTIGISRAKAIDLSRRLNEAHA